MSIWWPRLVLLKIYRLVFCAPSIPRIESTGGALHPGLRSAFWLHTKRYTKATKKKRCKGRTYGVGWIKTNFFLSLSLGVLQKGTCSKDRVRRRPVEALCGSGTVERNGQSGRTRNLRCRECPATSPRSVSLWKTPQKDIRKMCARCKRQLLGINTCLTCSFY